MKQIKKRIIYLVSLIVAAIVVGVLNACFHVGSESLLSFATLLGAISFIKLIKLLRIARNRDRLKEYETAMTEERVKFIAQKAAYFAFYISELILTVVLVYLIAVGNEVLMQIVTLALCIPLFIYVVCYIIFSRKY